MIQETIEKIYEQNKYIIKNRATYYSKYNGAPTKEDLESEGKVVFFQALKTYNNKKGKFSTHLWNNLTYSLSKTLKDNQKENRFSEPQKEDFFEGILEKDSSSFNPEEALSAPAAEVTNIIIENELTHLSQLTKILISKGYKQYPFIQNIYKEIRKAISLEKRRGKCKQN